MVNVFNILHGWIMVVDYQSRKKEILSYYDNTESIVSELQEFGYQIKHDLLNNCYDRINAIRNMANKIKADQFRIMVAGEAKSGKSTFINAYLGTNILPMDVKQCTSSIINIKHSNEFSAKITYAGGAIKKISNKDEIFDFLKKYAALDDSYRDIPITIINYELLVKSGMRHKEAGEQIVISEAEIKLMLEDPEVKNANIYNIPNYEEKIREYIAVTKENWENIIIRIEIFYPFSDDFQGIEIVDSPGISARGGIAEITSDYIKDADSIIFLKSIVGQSLESKEFNDFLDDNIVKRNKNTLFLVFTHCSLKSDSDIRRLEEEAVKQFSNRISNSNIFFVDSKAEFYLKQFSNIDNIGIEINKLEECGKLDDWLQLVYYKSKGDLEKFRQSMEEKSRFNLIYEALNSFGRKAHYLNMKELLGYIDKLYNILLANLLDLANSYEEKIKNPQELAQKIVNVKEELEILEQKLGNELNSILKEFTSQEGKIKVTINKRAEEFENIIKTIDDNADNAFDQLQDKSLQIISEYKELEKTIQQQVVSRFQEQICFIQDYDFISVETILPDFTQETFASIKESTEKDAQIIKIEEGFTFSETKKYPKYLRNKHVNLVRSSIIERMDNNQKLLISALIDFTNNIRDKYYTELCKNMKSKKEEYDAVLKNQDENDNLRQKIDKFKAYHKKLREEQEDIKKVTEGIICLIQ